MEHVAIARPCLNGDKQQLVISADQAYFLTLSPAFEYLSPWTAAAVHSKKYV